MKTLKEDQFQVRFSSPDPRTNIIEVIRVWPDESEETVGRIYPNYSKDGDVTSYTSMNLYGDESFPPTSDFNEIENHFKKSIKKIAEESFIMNMNDYVAEFEEREEALKFLRKLKSRKPTKLLTR